MNSPSHLLGQHGGAVDVATSPVLGYFFKNNLLAPAQSELYRANSAASGDSNAAYDGLGRMGAFARGTLSASGRNGTQLDSVAVPARQQSWALDALGNWSGVTTDGGTVTRTANAQNQTATVTGLPSAPTYDAAGNTTSNYSPAASGTLSYVYDAWNRLVAAQVAGVTRSAYTLDALGRRVTEAYPRTTTPQPFHLYDSALGQVLEERYAGTAATDVVRQYVWGLGYVNDLVERDGFGAGGVLVPSARLYALHDANHDITAIVDPAGVVQERFVYDPYGTHTVLSAAWAPAVGTHGWRYLDQGGRLDPATGLYHFDARDYSPGEGRWMQRDPIGQGGGDPNIYRFLGSSPVNYTDPSGTNFFSDYGHYFAENGGRLVGLGQGFVEQGEGLVKLIDPREYAIDFQKSLDGLREDGRKMRALYDDPRGYLSHRAQVIRRRGQRDAVDARGAGEGRILRRYGRRGAGCNPRGRSTPGRRGPGFHGPSRRSRAFCE